LTCRSQVVEQNINKDFWQIIHQFNKITDIPMVLNTSFNRHGISTISNPRQAIEHLLEGCFDVLYINKIKIKNTKGKKSQLKNQQIKISESMLLKQENYKWYKKNKYLLDSKDKKRFNFFLKQKFKKIL
jgi:predicted NodU family carbamoyl transferase